MPNPSEKSSTSTTSAWITLGLGLFGPLTYIRQDPRFEISFPPYAVNFIVELCARRAPLLRKYGNPSMQEILVL